MLKKIKYNLDEIFLELEQLDDEWIEKNPKKSKGNYENIWLPEGEVRLWNVPRTTGQLLRSLMLIKKPKTTLEIGTSAGYSTLWLASAAITYGGKVYTIEAAKTKIEMAKKYFKRSGLDKSIIQIHNMADNALQKFTEQIDLLFMDADKMNYYKYMQIIESKLSSNAVIVADNVIDFGEMMKDFTSYLMTSPNFETQIIDLDHGILVSVKK